MKKICCIIPSLGGGGAERVAFHLLNNLNIDRFQLSYITIYEGLDEYEQKLRTGIEHISLNKKRIRDSIFGIYSALKILKPDIVIVFSFELMIILGIFIIPLFKDIYFINRQVNLVSKLGFNRMKLYLIERCINRYRKIITQSHDMTEDLVQHIDLNIDRIVEINNPVDEKFIEEMLKEKVNIEYGKESKNLLCVGRLASQKGFDLIIKIMKSIAEKNIKLYIIGEGKEKNKLLELIKILRLEDRVFLLGKKENPYIYMKNADLFILSSRFEGFPNALIEANMCGTYAICNDSLGGINEIIREDINGNIVDFLDVEETKKIILEKLNNINILDRNKIRMEVQRYTVEKIIIKYEKCIQDCFVK